MQLMKSLFSFLLLTFLLVTCGEPENYSRNDTRTYNTTKPANPGPSNNTDNNSGTSTTNTYNNTDKSESENNIQVEVSKTLFLAKENIFEYCNDNKIDPVIIKLGLNNIFMQKTDLEFSWHHIQKIKNWNTTITNGTVTHSIVTEDMVITFNTLIDNPEINSIKFKQTYNNKVINFSKTTNKITSTSTSNNLRYTDNNIVEVQKNDNLKLIVERYNLENNSNYSLQEVVKMNPFLKKRNLVIHPGDLIYFNK